MFTSRFFKECDNDEIYDALKSLGGNVTLSISGEGISFSGGKPVKIHGWVICNEYESFQNFHIEGDGVYFTAHSKEWLKTRHLEGFKLLSRSIDYSDLSEEDLATIAGRVKDRQYHVERGDHHRCI
jgi:hypothetical protein